MGKWCRCGAFQIKTWLTIGKCITSLVHALPVEINVLSSMFKVVLFSNFYLHLYSTVDLNMATKWCWDDDGYELMVYCCTITLQPKLLTRSWTSDESSSSLKMVYTSDEKLKRISKCFQDTHLTCKGLKTLESLSRINHLTDETVFSTLKNQLMCTHCIVYTWKSYCVKAATLQFFMSVSRDTQNDSTSEKHQLNSIVYFLPDNKWSVV